MAEDRNFGRRVAVLRKEKGLSQMVLSEKIGVHVTQLRRYEAGTSQPTLDVLRRMARALQVSADALLFAPDERGPDDEFRYAFEALGQLDDEERKIVKALLDGLLLKHQAKRFASG